MTACGREVTRPCAREAGHSGVCQTAAAGLPTVELLLRLLRDRDALIARHGGAARIPEAERLAWEARKREVIARIKAARR